jgi:hypothetical protein
LTGRNLVEQQNHIMLNYERLYMLCREEAFGDHALELLQQRVEEPARVQQCDGLVVNFELPLAQKFRKFFEGSKTPSTSDNTASANEVTKEGDNGF